MGREERERERERGQGMERVSGRRDYWHMLMLFILELVLLGMLLLVQTLLQ